MAMTLSLVGVFALVFYITLCRGGDYDDWKGERLFRVSSFVLSVGSYTTRYASCIKDFGIHLAIIRYNKIT